MSDSNNTKAKDSQKEAKTVNKKDQELEELKAQNKLLMEKLNELLAAQKAPQATQSVVPSVSVVAPNTDVVIVYMSEKHGYIHLSNNFSLVCKKFGESYTLTRYQADELVGKYRGWFDRGILAIDPKNIEFAAQKGVRTSSEYGISAERLAKMGKMTVAQLQALWDENPAPEHRTSIVMYYKRKIIEGDPDYVSYESRAKIDLLDRLTDGGFRTEIEQVTGLSKKISPIDIGAIDTPVMEI